VFYDQLGCDNSAHPGGPDPWDVAPFLEELSAVRRKIGLQRVHLFGHSWGGMLAMEPTLVAAVVSGPMAFECRQRFYEKLPPDAREAIRRRETAGTFDNPEYGEAIDLFYRRYACRSTRGPTS
jgi:proline-specific peptidase